MDIKALADNLQKETEKIIVGKSDCIRKVILALLAEGNVLFSDLPGCGKTTLAKTISLASGLNFNRIQFVSDMLPSDILGMEIFNQKTGDFVLRKGPIETNILLADEINRAIPRTQSALLEAMEEREVSIEGKSFPLPRPFIVLATQNPIENESTFALPSAQMDRFLISLSIGYPSFEEEKEMLRKVGDGTPYDTIKAVSSEREILQAQKECKETFISDECASYIVRIVDETRKDQRLKMGASPRASRSLYSASKVWAKMHGRDYVNPDDIKEIVSPVLSHRLVLSSSSKYAGLTIETILDDILSRVEIPERIKEIK